MNNDSIIQITLSEGKKIVVEDDTKKTKLPFIRLGVNRKGEHMDLVDIVMDLSKVEQQVVKYIKNSINYCPFEKEYVPIVKLNRGMLADTESQKKKVSTAISSLRKKDIIGKIDKYNYMINPDLLLPGNYDKYKEKWDSRQQISTKDTI